MKKITRQSELVIGSMYLVEKRPGMKMGDPPELLRHLDTKKFKEYNGDTWVAEVIYAVGVDKHNKINNMYTVEELINKGYEITHIRNEELDMTLLSLKLVKW